MRLTDDQLDILAADMESDRVERKRSLEGDGPTKVREAICAFANDLPGHKAAGVAFVGLCDDGSPSGLAITDLLLQQLADMRSDGQIVPPPTLSVEKRVVRGRDVAVVTVLPSDSPPVRYRGRIWIRVGPSRRLAEAGDERVLSERRRHADRPFDVQPVRAAKLEDLDRRMFEEYLSAAFARDVLAANERTFEERLAATKMVVDVADPVPTVLGVLVLSVRTVDFLPGAYVQFLRIAGRELADTVRDEQQVAGPVTDVVRRLDEKLEAHNSVEVDLKSGSLERRRPQYPRVALQQVVRNAIMHRSYEATNSPVRVTWFDDRVEVVSPGGPYGTVTMENFGRPGVADYRNPSLAEAMKVLGIVQRFGVGIATAQRELLQNGNPPLDLEPHPTHVLVTLRASR